MSSRLLIAVLSTLLFATACVPPTSPTNLPPPPPPPPMPSSTHPASVPASPSTPGRTSITTLPTADCTPAGSPPPSLPDTDCAAWGMLYSLVMMTNGMANKSQPLTESERLTLETELNPLFVQAQLNCAQWVEPYNDYEPITDILGFLSFLGMDSYGYDPPSLLRFLIEQASTEEFSQKSDSIGCTKSLLLLFVEYSE